MKSLFDYSATDAFFPIIKMQRCAAFSLFHGFHDPADGLCGVLGGIEGGEAEIAAAAGAEALAGSAHHLGTLQQEIKELRRAQDAVQQQNCRLCTGARADDIVIPRIHRKNSTLPQDLQW